MHIAPIPIADPSEELSMKTTMSTSNAIRHQLDMIIHAALIGEDARPLGSP